MNTRKLGIVLVIVVLAAAAFVGVGTWKVYAQGPNDDLPCGHPMRSWGMMGGYYNNDDAACADGTYGYPSMMGGRGMMMGGHHQGGMMGGWYNQPNGNYGYQGMMGGWYNQPDGSYGYQGMMDSWTPPSDLAPAGTSLTLDEASAIAEAYVVEQGDSTLALGDVVDFGHHFHATIVSEDDGQPVSGFMIDAITGTVYSGYGCLLYQ
ncbi:MAG TPA: hypothetical protein PKD09_01230 [Aggregatilinea sp.]|uniref:hypothetical protein n=1 Tax=Aggregatilinea sp. TaxID=2806333 RepID=UPI002C254DAB|nr:hypothetical protein [Aggregatilinea sp.]HML20236.1 hypothetical protein [Aggregatilinea sp.]